MVPPQRIDALEQKVAELADAVRALQPSERRGFWRRLVGK
jgi:hypothetical protein